MDQIRIKALLTKTAKVDTWEDSESEEEEKDEELDVYYSEHSSEDEDLEYNPQIEESGNPAIYLAEGEKPINKITIGILKRTFMLDLWININNIFSNNY